MNVLTKEIAILCGKPMQIKLEDSSGGTEKTKQVKKQEEPKKNEEKREEEDILDTLDIPINFVEE